MTYNEYLQQISIIHEKRLSVFTDKIRHSVKYYRLFVNPSSANCDVGEQSLQIAINSYDKFYIIALSEIPQSTTYLQFINNLNEKYLEIEEAVKNINWDS